MSQNRSIDKKFNSDPFGTLIYSFIISFNSKDLQVLFDIPFIRFGRLQIKLQSFSEDASVLQVFKLNTNYAIKFYKWSGKKNLPSVYQKMFLNI